MNMNQPDPGGLFEPLKQKQQAPAATTSVISQLQNRPAPSGSLPRVNVPDSAIATPQAGQPAPSTNPLVELSRSGKLKQLLAMKAQQMQQQQAAPPQNPLVQLAQNGGIRKLILAKEDQQYEQALTDYEQWQQSPYRTMGAGGLRGALTRKAPEPPARSFDEIESDWNRGIQHLRGSELGKMLNTLETGQMTPEQEARITQHIEPQLPPDIRKQLQIARLTRDKLETLSQSAAQEEQAAEAFGQKSLYMTPGQIARDQDFSKMSETGNVFWRNVGHELTLGHGFAPDEDRLNSADADVAADERARRLFYRQQNAKYPVSAFAGSVLGAAPHIAATGMALRGARVANAMRSVKAGVPTQQAANVIASKGAATTTGGRVAMGAAEGAAFDIARRPEGAEDMTLTENLAARAQQVGFGAALGSLAELGLIKGGNLVGWIKDKRINGQLRKEAEAAGYGSDVDGYLNDQLNIERTDDGRYLFRAKRGAVTDLPDLEPVPHEAGTLAAADQPDTLRFDTGSEPPATGQPATGAPQPEVTTGAVHPPPVSEPADLAGLGGQGPAVPPQSAERAGTGETPPPVAGRTQSPVERVTTIRGTPVDVEYQLVDVDDLTTSHIGTGVTNPDYPAELQPRDRTRVASEANLLDMANNLRPEWLGRSPKASDGAPIVGDDSVVESGNGRVSALRYAYALGKGEDYREWLKANADQFGLDAATIDGMNKPVLVRRRTTPMDMEQRAQFTREANQSDLAGLSASEQARMDANRLTDDDIMMFAPDESGNINTAANAPFLRRFIDRVGRLEAGSMVDSQGRPNADMVQRIQAAIFKRAYDDDRLLSLMAETTGADMRSEAARNMLSALNRAAPSFARARAFGDIPAESDFIPNLMEAVDLVRQSRRNNQALSEVISQGSLLEPVDPVTQELAMFFDANLRSSQRMGDVLKDLGQQLEQEVMRGGDDLFGAGPARKEDFVANLKRRNQPDEQGLHEQPGEIIPEPETAARPGQPGRAEAEPVPAETGTGSGAGEPAGTGRTAAGDAGNENERLIQTADKQRFPLEDSPIDIDAPYAGKPVHIERTFKSSLEKIFPDLDKVHKRAKKWAQQYLAKLKDKTVINKETGQEIELLTSGFKHTIQGAGSDLIETIPYTKELLEKGKYRGWSHENKGKQDVLRVHYYETPIEIDGKSESAWISVTEKKNGKFYYDTAIKANSDEDIARLSPHRDLKPRHSLQNAHQGDGAESTLAKVSSDQEEINTRNIRSYANSEAETGAESARIHVEAPEGSTEIPVSQNADGSITADGKKIPKGGAYVTNTHKGKTAEQELSGGTLYSNPVNLAIRQMAASMNLGQSAASAFGGGVYGATTENDIGSEQWWLAVMGGAAAGVFGSAALRYNKVIGKDSLLSNFTRFLGQQYERIPGLGRGSPEIRRLKKQQQLMRQIINRQTGQVGEFLARNFTPAERAEMADIIENRGYPKQMNLVARQAKELDDFIAYTSERMKELGMLDPGTETGGYLHRYYTRHLKLDMADDLKKAFKVAKKQSLSGSYSIRRGTEETFSAEYLSPAVREQLAEYDRIHTEIKALEKKAGDLVAAQTDDEILALKDQLKGLQDIGLKEYIGVQNGKPRSFIFMPDEVPTIPGLDQPASRQQPMTDNLFSETGQRLQLENTMANQPMPTDRTWSLRGMAGDQPVLWRDWTKAEREKWGEIQDAGYRFVRGQAEVAHDLSMSTMFHKISQRSDWVSDTPRTIDGEDWIEVPDTKIHKTSPLRKYGALSGKYVKPDVWRAMRYYNQPLFGRGRAATVYRNMLDRWKIYKTVYNPVSHFNNAVSNLQMYYMAGYSARNLGNSLAELRKGENSQLWREARDVGLFGSDWTSSLTEGGEKANSLNELAELLRNQPDMPDADVVVDSLSAINRFKEWWIESRNAVRDADGKLASGAALARSVASPTLGVLNKPIKKATDSAKWLYQKEDELFKLAVFIEERNKGVKPFEAMEAANRFFFDYNDLPDIVRKVKDFPIGSPFISYTYLALPAIVRNAVERPEHMLALAAGFEAVNYASLALDGKLQEDGYWDRMEAENTLNPSWQKGRTMWGALNNIDISGFKPGLDSYKISLANAHAMGNPFAGEGVKDLPLWPDFMAFWGPDPIGGNPVTRIPFDILMNQNWKGEPLYTESDKYEQSLKYAYQAIFPSMPLFPGGWHNKKVIEGMAGDIDRAKEAGEEPNRLAEGIVQAANAVSEALGGEQFTGVDWKGNQFKTQDALAGSVGVKLRPYRAKDLYGYQVNKVVMDMKEESLSYKRKVRGNYTKAQMAQMKQAYKERMDKHREKLDAIKQAYQVIK